jgi:hypothetical protein
MNLTEEPEIVSWPETHYVYLERIGPFMKTAPGAWQDLRELAPLISERNRIVGGLSLYKMQATIYRAGYSLAEPPVGLPAGVEYMRFGGGKYSRFVLTGPYFEMPQASGRVWEIVSKTGIPVRDDFAIENYLNDLGTTPAEKLVTEILIPTV